MGKYDNLMKEDVFKVFGEENVNKVIEIVTHEGKEREDFIKALKEHERYETAVLVLMLLKRKIVYNEELKKFYHNDISNELRTGTYLPCC